MTRVVCVGLGAIGTIALERAVASDRFTVVAAIDPRRASDAVAGVEVAPDLHGLEGTDADVAMVATGSTLEQLAPLASDLLDLGLHVVSTCEALALPWYRTPELARRRHQLRDKLGVGRPVDTWRSEAEEQGYGHHGLVESACLCALAAGWALPDHVEFTRDPVDDGHGIVAGIREVAELQTTAGQQVRLELVFAMGARDEDRIELDGPPPISAVFDGGVQGESATVARLLSSARAVGGMAPGLRLPFDVPVVLGSLEPETPRESSRPED